MKELSRTRIFPDPVDKTRFIRGVLFEKENGNTLMEVWFYKSKKDNEPYFKTMYTVPKKYGTDDSFIPYHRRPLFRGLLNTYWRLEYENGSRL